MDWISPSFGNDEHCTPSPKRTKMTNNPSTCSETEAIGAPSSWLLKYKPKKISNLAIQLKKIKELEQWLKQAESSPASMLLLTGHSGCGKTTTFEIVCNNLGFKILEWITPLDKFESSSQLVLESEISQAKRFEQYLFRSSRYASCLNSNLTKTIILVKDFPNVFLQDPSSFHGVLENMSKKSLRPIVFISSENLICRSLFPNSIKLHTIKFNPIPNQKLLKALKSILLQEKNVNGNTEIISDKTLESICASSQGDLRNAVTKLHFRCVKTSLQRKYTHLESDVVQTPQDLKIDFFHGIGKVLHPKRIKIEKSYNFFHSPESIVEHFVGESKLFINQLHESYPTKFTNVLDLSDAAKRLAVSDVLIARWQDKDIFEEYALSVAIQGLMACNSSPHRGTFEPFRRPLTSHLEKDAKAVQLEGKAIFSKLFILDYECLSDILPYTKFLLPNLNLEQKEYVQKTCYF